MKIMQSAPLPWRCSRPLRPLPNPRAPGNIGGGIGIGVGGFTNGGINTDSLSSTSTSGVSGTINNELSASSGSGFGGTMNINSLPGGTSYAVVGGVGDAGSPSISFQREPLGRRIDHQQQLQCRRLMVASTHGNAALNMQVMNFGESAGDYKFAANFNASGTTSANGMRRASTGTLQERRDRCCSGSALARLDRRIRRPTGGMAAAVPPPFPFRSSIMKHLADRGDPRPDGQRHSRPRPAEHVGYRHDQ